MIAGEVFYSPVAWVSAVLAGVDSTAAFIDFQQHPFLLFRIFDFLETYHIGQAALLVLVARLIMAVICFSTSHYEMRDDTLIVRHGFFSKFSRAGRFKSDANTISYKIILDADYVQNLIQGMCKGSGTVRLRTADGEFVFMAYVENPNDVVSDIMSVSGIKDARFYTRINNGAPQ